MRVLRMVTTAALLLVLTASAAAQEVVQKSFAAQLFEPAIGLDTYFTVEGPNVADHLGFGVGLIMNYQRKPLSLYYQTKQGTGSTGFTIEDATVVDVVKDQMTADLVGVIGLHYKWLHSQVGFDLPVNLVVMGNDVDLRGERTGDLSASGVGDLKLQLKARIFHDLMGFSLAFSPILTFPTGKKDGFGGDPNVSFRPRVVAGYQHGPFMAAANIGGLFRESSRIFSSEVSHQLLYGAGAGYQVHRRILLLAEIFGRAGFATSSGCQLVVDEAGKERTVCAGTSNTDLDAYPLEADLGGRVRAGYGIDVSVGMGFGLIKAIGSPQYRVLAGLRWAPDFKDTDKDGIADADDKCPTQPEDKDGFQDADGCPDPDNDQDLIPDEQDKCPMEAEDKDGFQDDDGCPEADNDGDGIPDLKDACPFQAETKNGFKDEDGCPDVPDKDEDGIPDTKDRCPTDPEDKDGFEDLDGCPDPDNDGDGVPDKFDDCPNAPEDMDSFKDDDGCPDPDNDGDGVLDKDDKCPDKPETINGFRDEDGCPDKGESNVIIKENKIVIMKKIYFDTNKAKIKRVSNSILGEVILTLRIHPEIRGVRIEGHTDSRGNATRNKELSQQRAEAVRDYLVQKGIEPSRLFAIGFGPEKPIADNRTGKGREENRRVDFIILEQAPGEKPESKSAP